MCIRDRLNATISSPTNNFLAISTPPLTCNAAVPPWLSVASPVPDTSKLVVTWTVLLAASNIRLPDDVSISFAPEPAIFTFWARTLLVLNLVPSNSKLAEVVVSSVEELYRTLPDAPTTSVALSAVPVKSPVTLPVTSPVTLPVKAPLNVRVGYVFYISENVWVEFNLT